MITISEGGRRRIQPSQRNQTFRVTYQLLTRSVEHFKGDRDTVDTDIAPVAILDRRVVPASRRNDQTLALRSVHTGSGAARQMNPNDSLLDKHLMYEADRYCALANASGPHHDHAVFGSVDRGKVRVSVPPHGSNSFLYDPLVAGRAALLLEGRAGIHPAGPAGPRDPSPRSLCPFTACARRGASPATIERMSSVAGLSPRKRGAAVA